MKQFLRYIAISLLSIIPLFGQFVQEKTDTSKSISLTTSEITKQTPLDLYKFNPVADESYAYHYSHRSHSSHSSHSSHYSSRF